LPINSTRLHFPARNPLSMLAIKASEAVDRVCSSPQDVLEVHSWKTTKSAIAQARSNPIADGTGRFGIHP
jgi:hypothetical protein